MSTLATAIVGIVLQLVIGAFIYGKLTGKVAEHDRRHSSHDQRFGELSKEQTSQWESIGRHGERLSKVETIVQRARPQHGD